MFKPLVSIAALLLSPNVSPVGLPAGFVSVTDFGAEPRTGNGPVNCAEHDDAPAIEAALLASPNVYFPPGTYDLCTTIDISLAPTEGTDPDPRYQPARILRGAGSSSIPNPGHENVLAEARTILMNHSGGAALVVGSLATTTIERMSIQDATGTGTAGVLMDVPGQDSNARIALNELWIEGHDVGVKLVRPMVAKVENVVVNAPRTDGFQVLGHGTSLNMINAYSRRAGRDGFHLEGMSYSTLINCASDGSQRYGYFLGDLGSLRSMALSMLGCGAENSRVAGIRSEHVNALSILAPNVIGPGPSGDPNAPSVGISISGGRGMTMDSAFIANADIGVFVEKISRADLSIRQPRFSDNGTDVVAENSGVWPRWLNPGTTALAVPGTNIFELGCTAGARLEDLTQGLPGQQVVIGFTNPHCTVGFSGASLQGNGQQDWTPATGDHMTCVSAGSRWYCQISR